MQVTVRFCSVPLQFRGEHLGVDSGLPPLFSFHQPHEMTCGSTVKMQHQEGVVRNLCKFQGRLTSLSYANDVKCVALLRTWRTIKGKRGWRMANFIP
ncbi:hypothetical protein TNCV_1322621 [Trichonephila clavipes]|nr:hypothetical protein TNCV_1322621 [Trichonephila clavipes]